MNSLYISDLDGTLLQNDATLSDFAEKTLRRLLTEGLLFTIASARSVVSMQGMLRGLPLSLPVIEFNGAFLSDLTTGKHEIINAIEPSIALSVYEQILKHDLVPFVSSFDGSEDHVHYDAIINDGMHWYLNDRLRHRDGRWHNPSDLAASLREQVVCFTVVGKDEPLAALQYAVLQVHAGTVETHLFENQYSPGWHWLTVHDYRATKDRAIRLLIERYGLSGSEIAVFGDQSNDLKMFQIADRAIAVANATEELKHHADRIIGSNEDDSVVRFIAEDWMARKVATDSYIPEGAQ
ncbi:MAG: HAD-IIB family hydrolase [Janthinobacterium lividum]